MENACRGVHKFLCEGVGDSSRGDSMVFIHPTSLAKATREKSAQSTRLLDSLQVATRSESIGCTAVLYGTQVAGLPCSSAPRGVLCVTRLYHGGLCAFAVHNMTFLRTLTVEGPMDKAVLDASDTASVNILGIQVRLTKLFVGDQLGKNKKR